jgi:ankyrin repeat protein
VAAARHVLFRYGPMEIEGHAFCLGLDALKIPLEEPIYLVSSLIRGAIFRPRQISTKQGRLSLNISSLGELVDAYHSHEAKERHDKVYALLGMSSDETDVADLTPNYAVPWEILMKNLVTFLLGHQVSVDIRNDTEIAIVEGKGFVVGRVSSIMTVQSQKIDIEVTVEYGLQNPKYDKSRNSLWSLPPSAKSLKEGDIICLLQGAKRPSIIRPCNNHFLIIMIAANPPEHLQTELLDLLQSEELFTRDILLIWDWGKSSTAAYDNLISRPSSSKLDHKLTNPSRVWSVALILGDVRKDEKTENLLKEAIEGYKRALGEEHPHSLESEYGLTPLGLAARNGYMELIDLLLRKDGINFDLEDWDGRTPLWWAAEHGHEAVVSLLLETGKVNVDSKDRKHGQTPLWRATENGHNAVVKLLLDTGKVDLHLTDRLGHSILWRAAENGHEAVTKLLLETGKVDAGLKDRYHQTALWWAAGNGHDAVVRLLLETGKVDVDSKNRWRTQTRDDPKYAQTPLSRAAQNGHEAVVKLLLETGKVEVDSQDYENHQTPLARAAQNGHEAVVKMLLVLGKADVNKKDGPTGKTPLWRAAENGHENVVKLLLETGKVSVDSRERFGQTPLSRAAEKGHVAVVKLLLKTGEVNINSVDQSYRTPLRHATKNKHGAIIKLLLETGKIDIDVEDRYGNLTL